MVICFGSRSLRGDLTEKVYGGVKKDKVGQGKGSCLVCAY